MKPAFRLKSLRVTACILSIVSACASDSAPPGDATHAASAAGGHAAGATAGGGGQAAGTTGAAASGSSQGPADDLMLPVTMEPGGAEPWFNVYRPTDLAATGQPLPVIAWANGGCYRSDFTWAPLFNRWAAGGFVVLALTASPTGAATAMSSVSDQKQLVDWALAQADMEGSPYAGKLDTTRIVVAGNSCGGVTALGVAAMDSRVAAVFVLSGSSALGTSNKDVMGAINVPVGYVVGGPMDDIAYPAANMDYDLLPDGVPAMVVNRSSGNHLTVSTDMTVLPQDAEIAFNWMKLALYGSKQAAAALTSPDVCAVCEPGMWTLKSKNLDKLQH
jgi:hypothetical protein